MILNAEQFGRHFVEFKSSATRIETLEKYTVLEEKDNFSLYLTGASPPPQRNEEWAGNIRECVANGKYMGRVHIISSTLTPYLQFEIDWYYAINSAAGEDIRFIFRDDVPDITYADTWIFDDEIVVDLSYDNDGCLLYMNENDDPVRLEQAKAAWAEFYRRSFPLPELLAKVRGSNLDVPRT